MSEINFTTNIYNFNSNGIQADYFQGINPRALDGIRAMGDFFSGIANFFETTGNSPFSGNQDICAGGCIPPNPSDSTHPEGSLKAENGVITTPGGYKIEPMGQFEWKITGPDGKTTRVWGDPHVEEGDGGKWDFKRNSTFVLGDGTRINVTTAPWGNNGMTVTSGLEVISGNDRVTVSGIDKGKGVVGQVTQDGYAHSNTFGGNDVFVMGKETDDWSYQGKEIVGSNNGGESFKLGNPLAAGNTQPTGINPTNAFNFRQQIHQLVDNIINGWNQNWRPNQLGSNPYYNGLSNRNDFRSNDRYNRGQHQDMMREAFRLFGNLFGVLGRLSSLNDQMYAGRYRTFAG